MMADVPDGPAKEFAKHYTSLKGGPSIKEREKFFNFVNQMKTNNPDAKKILMDPEFGAHYRMMSEVIDDQGYMGKIGNRLSYEAFSVATEEPRCFYKHLDKILRDQGIREGVTVPRDPRRPVRPGFVPLRRIPMRFDETTGDD